MHKLWAAWMLVFLFAVGPAYAWFASEQVCQNSRLPNNSTLDCRYTDTSQAKSISTQINCKNNGTVALSVSADYVAGSAAGSAYMGIPKMHIDGSTGLTETAIAIPRLVSTSAAENSWTTLIGHDIPVSPAGTIRLTNHTDDSLSLVDCTVILNMKD